MKSASRLRVEKDLATKGWTQVQAQPLRTDDAARSMIHNAARELGLRVTTTWKRDSFIPVFVGRVVESEPVVPSGKPGQ